MAVSYWGLRTGADNLDARLPDSMALRPIGVFNIGLLTAVPMWLLSRFLADPRHKAFARTLSWAGGFMVATCWTQVTPLEQDQLTALLNLAGIVVYIGLVLAAARLHDGRDGHGLRPLAHRIPISLCLGPLIALP
jgi:hypothetical protein